MPIRHYSSSIIAIIDSLKNITTLNFIICLEIKLHLHLRRVTTQHCIARYFCIQVKLTNLFVDEVVRLVSQPVLVPLLHGGDHHHERQRRDAGVRGHGAVCGVVCFVNTFVDTSGRGRHLRTP